MFGVESIVGPEMKRDAAVSLRAAEPSVFWLQDPARPAVSESLVGDVTADLAVVGGGYSGLWTALRAKERDPGREVVLLEGSEVGWAASGRNGGFCEASLTHGYLNGMERFSEELPEIERQGLENLDEIEDTIGRYSMDAEFERTGELAVAVEDWQVERLAKEAKDRANDPGLQMLTGEGVQELIKSSTYRAGLFDAHGCALVQPAKLAWALKLVCLELGVRIFERTPVRDMRRSGRQMVLTTDMGLSRASQVALGTNAFPSLVRRLRAYTVPVYDYVLMTEPLTAAQLDSVGWKGRQAVMDSGNQFHYYRLTADNRILWGGYDAIYHFGRKIRPELDQRVQTHAKLAEHFFQTFPQLTGIRFTHRWGGAIDTCTRFCAFFGLAHGGRVAYAAGFTGLGVGATRFGANVMLDLLGGESTKRTQLDMVKKKPLPFPPEPLSFLGIQATRASLNHADRNNGRRNLWLRALDRAGLGFDS
jgi:glycine/D-amino acid oxidase-like deaminating enzyme